MRLNNDNDPPNIKALRDLMIWEQDNELLPPEFRTPEFKALPESQRHNWIIAKINDLRGEADMPEARPMTKDEAVDKFLKQVAGLAHYWGTLPDQDQEIGCGRSPLDRVNGFAFSLLSMIDGSNLGIPAMNLHPAVTDEDIEYLKSEGENWFNPREAFNDETAMHEIWKNYELSE